MDLLKKGWFTEINDVWPGVLFSLEIEKVLHKEKSDYQDVLVLDTKTQGRILVLDGLIQCSESDEFTYQEGISFIPLCSHPNPEKVLLIGGGGGGLAREVAKHPSVKSITQVEIDARVVELTKKYLPFSSAGLKSKKLNLIIGDGFEYMKQFTNEFDVIITDCSDPVGPSLTLFQESYYKLMKKALRPGGIICSQAGSVWASLNFLKTTLGYCRSTFAQASYSLVPVPTFPTGQIGFIVGSLNPDTNFAEPLKVFTEKELDDMELRFYDADVHRAAFVLPRFVAKELASGGGEKDACFRPGKLED